MGGNGQRDGEGGLAEGDVDLRRRGGAHGFDEGGELALERLGFLHGDVLAFEAGGSQVDVVAGALVEVHGHVAGALEEPPFARAFFAEAGDVEVGDAAVLEDEARVGDVHVRGEDGGAGGVNALERGVDEFEDEADVVDHQVEDDVDLLDARVDVALGGVVGVVFVGVGNERGEALGADEARLADVFLEKVHDRIEVLDVANLDEAVGSLRGGDDLLGLVEGGAERLFDEQMAARGEQREGDGAVEVGRRDDADDIAGHAEGGEGVEGRAVIFGRDFGGAGGVGVVNAGEGDAGKFGVEAGVVLAEVADAGDAGTEGSRHRMQNAECRMRKQSQNCGGGNNGGSPQITLPLPVLSWFLPDDP